MIAAINNNFSFAPCAQSNCEPQPIQGQPDGDRGARKKEDQIRISDQAREQFDAQAKSNSAIKNEKDLSEEERRQVEKLKRRDQDVKAHERAHMAAGSDVVVGGASYEYEHGPDGKMYAVGGEVKIDTSKENSPDATIRKMQKVRKAALAPAQPSAQDRSVAAKAAQIEAEARIELQEQKAEKAEKENHRLQESPFGISTNPFSDSNHSSQIGRNLSIMV